MNGSVPRIGHRPPPRQRRLPLPPLPSPPPRSLAMVLLAWSLCLNVLVAFGLMTVTPSPSPRGLLLFAVTTAGFAEGVNLHTSWNVPEPFLSPPPHLLDDAFTVTEERVDVQTEVEVEAEDAATSARMRTSLRLCPANPSSVILSSGTRWVHPVAPLITAFTSTVDEAGTRVLASSLPSTLSEGPYLRYGIGYGLPAHESTPWHNTHWSTYTHQQEFTRLHRNADPTAPFDIDPPHLSDRLQWLSSYDFHDLDQRAKALPLRYEPTRAPWYEVEVKDEGGDLQRLMVMEAEWLQMDQPFRRGLWGAGQGAEGKEEAGLVDGVNLLVVLMPTVPYYDGVNVSLFDIPFSNDALATRLFSRIQCSFTADTSLSPTSPLYPLAQTTIAGLQTATPLPVSLMHNPLWTGISHHFVRCPLPSIPLAARRLLTHPDATLPLSLTSLSLHIAEDEWKTFGFRSLTSPLCHMRAPYVTTAVLLSSQLGPPHMWRPSQLHDFLAYYLFLGVERFHIPDRYGSLLPSLLPYMARGLVSYTRQPFLTPHHQPYLDQVPVLAAALMRERGMAEWVLSVDLDELLSFDHPYWSDGEGVHPPHDSCFQPRGREGVKKTEGRVGRCGSMLEEFFAQPGLEEVSLMVLPSVPQWGLSPHLNVTLSSLSSQGGSMTQFLETLTPYHPLAVWSRRSHSAEFHRFKCLFRPRHVSAITMHDVTANEVSVKAQVTRPKIEAWHKYWGDSGLQGHKEHILAHTTLTDSARNISYHLNLNLHSLLCHPTNRVLPSIKVSFNLTCCDTLTAATGRTSSCFTRLPSFDSYLLSTLTPLFPTVAQSNPKAPPHLLLPVKLPLWTYGSPLAIFGLYVSHVFCMFLHPRVWPQCDTNKLTWNKGPMWGEGKRDGTAFDAEVEEERGKFVIRQQLQQWIDRQTWMEHRDMRGYAERQRRWKSGAQVGNEAEDGMRAG